MNVEIFENCETSTIQDKVVKFFAAMNRQMEECPLIAERSLSVYIPAYKLVGAGADSYLTEEKINEIKSNNIAFIDNHHVKGKTAVFTPDTYLILLKHEGANRALLKALKNLLVKLRIRNVKIAKEQDIEIDNMKVAGWAGTTCNETVGETMLITFHADKDFFESVLPPEEFNRTATVGSPLRGWDGIEDIIGKPINRTKFIEQFIIEVEAVLDG